MNKFILSTMMILASAGCFAKLPNMKELNGLKTITKRNDVVYSHPHDKGIPLYKTGTFKLSYLENYDPLTKCTFTVYGLRVFDGYKGSEPICVIEDVEGNLYTSNGFKRVEKKDHINYYFTFSENGKDYNFGITDFRDGYDIIGHFASFE